MGTPKRERQKANRAMKQAEEAKQAKNDAIKRNGLRWAAALALAIAAVVVIAWVGGAFDDDEEEAGGVETPVVETTDEFDSETAENSQPEAETTPADTSDTSDTGETDTAASETAASETDASSEPATGDEAECPPADGSAPRTQVFAAPPPMCIDVAKQYTATMVTNFGELTIELDAERAPLTVNNFVVLARYHYFDDTICHRAIPSFMVQCGDPTAETSGNPGTGGPGYTFEDELPAAGEYQIGSVAMANSGPNTNGSQFFMITGQQGVQLPPSYSLFGQITDGLDTTLPALDEVGNPADNGVPPLEEIRIESVTITES